MQYAAESTKHDLSE